MKFLLKVIVFPIWITVKLIRGDPCPGQDQSGYLLDQGQVPGRSGQPARPGGAGSGYHGKPAIGYGWLQ